MTLLKVAAAEFQRKIRRYQDLALHQPVAVTRNGRESTVLISNEEYIRLKRRDREVLASEELDAADIEAISNSKPSEAANGFNYELDADA